MVQRLITQKFLSFNSAQWKTKCPTEGGLSRDNGIMSLHHYTVERSFFTHPLNFSSSAPDQRASEAEWQPRKGNSSSKTSQLYALRMPLPTPPAHASQRQMTSPAGGASCSGLMYCGSCWVWVWWFRIADHLLQKFGPLIKAQGGLKKRAWQAPSQAS